MPHRRRHRAQRCKVDSGARFTADLHDSTNPAHGACTVAGPRRRGDTQPMGFIRGRLIDWLAPPDGIRASEGGDGRPPGREGRRFPHRSRRRRTDRRSSGDAESGLPQRW
jgi:hypothetical protein